MAFGRYVNTVYRPEKAEVILSLDADFMGEGPGHIRYMKEFYRRSKLENESSEMNRLYVVEPTPSITGASADHRLPLRSSDVGLFTRALAAKVGLGGTAEMPPAAQHWLETVRGELQAHRAACLLMLSTPRSETSATLFITPTRWRPRPSTNWNRCAACATTWRQE
jgi:molybdopterin-containing oxidoreductase family iron-sulfur binding subunit